MHVSNIPIDELKPFVKNPKKHPEKQLKFLQKSFKEFGWTAPILVAEDNMIVAGHGRWEAAKQAGFTEVPVIKLDMPYEKAVAYVIADNHLAELAETDTEQLAELLQEISQIEDFDIEATGFEVDDIEDMINELHPKEIIEDEVPDVPEEAVTQRGDVWELGRHRVMCGDSTDTTDVDKLMCGMRADMAFSDPPYNLNFDYNEYDDSKPHDEYKHFCSKWFANLVAFSHGNVVITPGKQNVGMWYGIKKWTEICIWVAKNKMSGGKVSHLSLFEPVLFYGDFDRASRANDLFEYNVKQQSDTGDHTCPKIIDFIVDIVESYSANKSTWLDLFGGSGTTLIACEQTDRRSYNMEYDPHYCDVIIQRYVNLTGNTELKRNGEPYTWQAKEK